MLSSEGPPSPCDRSRRDTCSFDVKPLEEPGQVSLWPLSPGGEGGSPCTAVWSAWNSKSGARVRTQGLDCPNSRLGSELKVWIRTRGFGRRYLDFEDRGRAPWTLSSNV